MPKRYRRGYDCNLRRDDSVTKHHQNRERRTPKNANSSQSPKATSETTETNTKPRSTGKSRSQRKDKAQEFARLRNARRSSSIDAEGAPSATKVAQTESGKTRAVSVGGDRAPNRDSGSRALTVPSATAAAGGRAAEQRGLPDALRYRNRSAMRRAGVQREEQEGDRTVVDAIYRAQVDPNIAKKKPVRSLPRPMRNAPFCGTTSHIAS